MRKLSLEEIQTIISSLYNGKYKLCENQKHEGSGTKLNFICSEHVLFTKTSYQITHNDICNDCSKEYRNNTKSIIKTKNFIDKANLIHNYKYLYTKVKYTNSKSYVTITCPKHGDFIQMTESHLKGHEGCKDCLKLKEQHNKMTFEQFVEKANLVHKNKYDYSLSNVNFNNIKSIIQIICPIH